MLAAKEDRTYSLAKVSFRHSSSRFLLRTISANTASQHTEPQKFVKAHIMMIMKRHAHAKDMQNKDGTIICCVSYIANNR